MTSDTLRGEFEANAHIASLEGLEGQAWPLLQFWGIMACGWSFSVRISRSHASLEVRSPERNRRMNVKCWQQHLEPRLANNEDFFGVANAWVPGWLEEAAESIREEGQPELITDAEMAEVHEADRLMAAANEVASQALWARNGLDPVTDKTEYDAATAVSDNAKRLATEAQNRWADVLRKVYQLTLG